MINQEFYCAATAYHEAGKEPFDGKVAVVHVILSRCLTRHLTAKEVVYQSKQFECFNKDKEPPIHYYQTFIECQMAVKQAQDERLLGLNFYGAEYFMNEKVVIARYGHLPAWLDNMTRVAIIGQHTFYKENK